MDSFFGIFITDELKLIHHRASVSGVMHRHNIRPLDPKPDEAVTVSVRIPSKKAFDKAALYYTTDGSTPAGSLGVAVTGATVMLEIERVEWDHLTWDYIIHWRGVIPGQPEGRVVQYVISAWSDKAEAYADTPNFDDTRHHAVMTHYENIPKDTPYEDTGHFPYEQVFSYHVDTLETPTWADDAVIYHIFLDRFYPGDGRDWVQTEDLEAICGGTLWGVHDKLDYIAELGVNCIWLGPTCESPTFHGYDVTDYRRVEPRLGGEAALRAVIEGAHQRGIRVLLDMVCNHLSRQHPIFQEAMNDENSPYRAWFFFDERVPHGYKAFFGVKHMPRINLNHPAARAWMIENALLWVKDFDIDGYRLDVADGPGPNFWGYFRRALRGVKPEVLIFGEIIDLPDRLRTYAGRLDGCLDFPLTSALRATYAREDMTEAQLEAFIKHNDAFYPADFVRPTFLDNHDMNRFSYEARDDKDKLKRAAKRQFALPGPAIIYYGTEVGVRQDYGVHERGYRDVRRLMLWGAEQDADLLGFYKAQIQAKKGALR